MLQILKKDLDEKLLDELFSLLQRGKGDQALRIISLRSRSYHQPQQADRRLTAEAPAVASSLRGSTPGSAEDWIEGLLFAS